MFCLAGGLIRVGDGQSPGPVSPVLFALLSCAALPWRHRAPSVVLAVTTAGCLLVQPLELVPSPVVVVPALFAAYSFAAAARTERQATAGVTLSSLVLLIGAIPWSGELSWQDASRLGATATFPLVAGILGRSTRHRQAYLAAVQERAVRAEQEREHEARRRVGEERLRIARELHDLVAHQITLANAQATVAAHLFDARPEQSRQSLTELVETTRQALDELRSTVGLLRQSGDSATPAEPAPGLAQLPLLLNSFRRAGLEVELAEEGSPRALPPGIDLNAYRIVQEALTNVTKHAATARAQVMLAWSSGHLILTVSNSENQPGASSRPLASFISERSSGYGLIGMRERAAAAGGELSAGPDPQGGFRVWACLPIPAKRELR
ncbi:sensor histidine kinase [Kineosporia babensis]|nr:sensor histidine kinase [Kineosporia babensis]